MKRLWQKFLLYAKLPEMRLFWLSLPFVVLLLAINAFYLPDIWLLISLAVFLALIAVLLVNNLRLARSNLEIKIERNELEGVISNLRDGVIAYDPNFRILIFNPAAEQIFNVRNKEVIGQDFSPARGQEPRFKLLTQVIFPSLAPLVIRRSEAGVYPQVIDISFSDPKMELRVSTDKISDPTDKLLGFVKVVRDRSREVALLRSKTEFITVAAHQLRTPLTGLHWGLETLIKQPSGDEQKEILNNALDASSKLLRIVNDLLDAAKIEEGRFGYKFENVNIVTFIEDVIKEVGDFAKQHNIKVYLKRPDENSLAASIDPQKLGMVLWNLLDNAIRYNVKNGEVVVGVERLKDKPYFQISVKDTGVGIPPDHINRLFTKFFRSENVVKFVPDGSGLGLYIAKNIVRRHGGEIWAESQINRGTTFFFTIPTDSRLIPSKEIIYEEE